VEQPTPSPTVLVLFAHGSPDPRWREPFVRLQESLERELGPGRVWLAYMEFARPSLLDVVKFLRGRGIRKVRLLPLFMSAGGHVAADIPRQTAEALEVYRDMTIQVLPPVGEHPVLTEALHAIAREALTRRTLAVAR
jgi:sirohydrochlorin cobaltochelatase